MLASNLHRVQLADACKVHGDRVCKTCLRSLKMRLASAASKLRRLPAPFKLALDLQNSCNDAVHIDNRLRRFHFAANLAAVFGGSIRQTIVALGHQACTSRDPSRTI